MYSLHIECTIFENWSKSSIIDRMKILPVILQLINAFSFHLFFHFPTSIVALWESKFLLHEMDHLLNSSLRFEASPIVSLLNVISYNEVLKV